MLDEHRSGSSFRRSDAAALTGLTAEKTRGRDGAISPSSFTPNTTNRSPRESVPHIDLPPLARTRWHVKLLAEALYDERESVRRAATYGLVAVGSDATGVFLEAATSQLKWVRKAGVFGLGDVGPLNDEVLKTVVTRLEDDPSVYVRSVAAGSLGCLGRRAVAAGVGTCSDSRLP